MQQVHEKIEPQQAKAVKKRRMKENATTG